MDKREYVSCIERALVGKINPAELRDIVQYYRDYIDMEIRKGKSEQQVLEELGDPRLLAKTIAATHGNGVAGTGDLGSGFRSRGTDGAGFEPEREGYNGKKAKSWHIPLVAVIGILLLILLLVASLVLSVVRILLPVVLPVLIILWIIRFFRKNQ